jgi:site-specific DNA-methyltransferase (adenine-specific)
MIQLEDIQISDVATMGIPCASPSIIYNMDCIAGMKHYPDKYFDLAVVDPPYGINRFKKGFGKTRFKMDKRTAKDGIEWDNKPTREYWIELMRVSKNQIVWGANNFEMPPSEYFLIWDKAQTVDNFSTAEYAWVSMGLKKPAKIYRYSIHKHNHTDKIHPTQKPIELYSWIYKNYATEGMKILDTHLGSGTNRIAAHRAKMDFTGFELDLEYFNLSELKYQKEIRQLSLF